MPVWKLNELQLVAAHIRENTNDQFLKEALTPEGIRKRYHRFGGIFLLRYSQYLQLQKESKEWSWQMLKLLILSFRVLTLKIKMITKKISTISMT